METIQDFEDILVLFEKHKVQYLIIGGLAFIYHAKPRYTKDIEIWIDSRIKNVKTANNALLEFGSPFLLTPGKKEEILQLGIAPDRIDILRLIAGAKFDTAWKNRIWGNYGSVAANWIDLNSLIRIKSKIDHPRHREDTRVLLEVRKRKAANSRKK